MKKKTVIIITLFISLNSCNYYENNILDNPKKLQKTFYEFEKIDKIHIHNIFDVYVKQDTLYKLTVETNADLIKKIKVAIDENSLIIKDLNKSYFIKSKDRKITLTISAPNLSEINFYSASTLHSVDTLNYERFLFRTYGRLGFCDITLNCKDHFFLQLWNVSGDYKIHGKIKYFELLDHGKSYVDATKTKTEYLFVKHKSTGNVNATVSQLIQADMYDDGNIYYNGNPEIKAKYIGKRKGKIYKIK